MKIRRILLKLFYSLAISITCFTSLITEDVQAQESLEKGDLVLRMGLGIGKGETTVARQSNSSIGVLMNGKIGIALSKKFIILVHTEIQPFKVENPVRAEAFRAVYILGAVQSYLVKGLYIRGGIGLTHLSWSGEDVWVSSERGIAIGASLGYEFIMAQRSFWGIEFSYYGTAVPELSASLLGFHITKSWGF